MIHKKEATQEEKLSEMVTAVNTKMSKLLKSMRDTVAQKGSNYNSMKRAATFYNGIEDKT